MKLVFVHGWSVTDTATYGELPEALVAQAPPGLNLDVVHVFLGRYISFHDEVTVPDIARAFEQARKDVIGENESFSCITHSTGGPVIREWVDRYYGEKRLSQLPLTHLIMLAPANHGSALAQLGKARVSRIKSWFEGVEPGEGVLNWLEFGSAGQWELNRSWLTYQASDAGLFTFVLAGQTIDKKLYDFINSYTAEAGSDGVVRVCAANMNYRYVKLRQNIQAEPLTMVEDGREQGNQAHPLEIEGDVQVTAQFHALEIIPNASHSGDKIGIMNSVKVRNARSKQVVSSILECLQVANRKDYEHLSADMLQRTVQVQGNKDKYAMVVFRVTDDQGYPVQDFDFYLLAGPDYNPAKLPKGFFMDRQKNRIHGNKLTYYLNATRMQKVQDGKLGFRIIARPNQGFTYYTAAEFRSGEITVDHLLKENETLLVDVVLYRHVDKHTFGISPLEDGHRKFKDEEPSGIDVP